MKKRLTLNRTWKLCLDGLWKWIAEQKKMGNKDTVYELKRRWFKNNLPDEDEYMMNHCFFCEYDERHKQNNIPCGHCPGKLVIKNFNCEDIRYCYSMKPIRFYEKLLWINKRRLNAKKRGENEIPKSSTRSKGHGKKIR